MIVLDTHVWVWWVHGDARLSGSHAKLIEENEDDEIGIGTISLWEVAKLVELGRLVLPVTLDEWFTDALAYPGVTLVDLTAQIAIESTQLPGQFHRDPADQIIGKRAALELDYDKIRATPNWEQKSANPPVI